MGVEIIDQERMAVMGRVGDVHCVVVWCRIVVDSAQSSLQGFLFRADRALRDRNNNAPCQGRSSGR